MLSRVHEGRLPPKESAHLRQEACLLWGGFGSQEGLIQIAGEGQNVGVAIARLAREGLHDDSLNPCAKIQVRARLVQGDGRLREQLREHLARTLREVWQRAGEKEIGNRRQRILVGCRGDELTGQRLGGDVHQRAHEVAGSCQSFILPGVRRRRDAEVEELGRSGDGIVHRVIGF